MCYIKSEPTSCSGHLRYKSTCIRHSFASILSVTYLPFRLYNIIIYILYYIIYILYISVCVILACSLVIFLLFGIIPCSNLLFITYYICTYALSRGNISIYGCCYYESYPVFNLSKEHFVFFVFKMCLLQKYYFFMTTSMLFIIFICI